MKPVPTILVVDDEEALRKALVFDFKRKGFHVLEAESGNKAFDVIRNQPVDLVISDVRMPDGDGVDLLMEIKKYNQELPVVIFVTGFADLTVEDAYDLGVNAIFSKPFDRKILMKAVERALLPRENRWNIPSVEVLGPPLAMQAHLIKVARGGFFAVMTDSFPEVNAPIQFKMDEIQGQGIVRWVRSAAVGDLPSGCGIEFVFLEPSSLKKILPLMAQEKKGSFIPKG